jgi:dimethylhistidine N-methyltransferase
MENVQPLYDFSPRSSDVLEEVLRGLTQKDKKLPPKLLYDKKGSDIFDEICDLPEYYPTRSEKEILTQNAFEIARLIGPDALILEPGAGVGEKIRLLLPYFDSPAGYVPIEISKETLMDMSSEIASIFPEVNLYPVCADMTQEFSLGDLQITEASKKVIFFPGSTIGNFTPSEASSFLRRMGKLVGKGGGLLIGVDMKKDFETLNRAYDDSQGVTASFNLNLLSRLNSEIHTDFNSDFFRHRAFYNSKLGRVEMHLESLRDQSVHINGNEVFFKRGETIHTESSYKYSLEEFTKLCESAGWSPVKNWQDQKSLFSVYYFERC